MASCRSAQVGKGHSLPLGEGPAAPKSPGGKEAKALILKALILGQEVGVLDGSWNQDGSLDGGMMPSRMVASLSGLHRRKWVSQVQLLKSASWPCWSSTRDFHTLRQGPVDSVVGSGFPPSVTNGYMWKKDVSHS